ncbi:hypothetical protein Sango_2520800 [Sesamum angolense]|uniref:GBF-interacting protein 1 N-terminal domain-containing protein n=1 Tax=Sesamum angolense TaxID=2727404 RepID=A0AAE1W4B0_9LAMI|nr:hypothetical protein Sango_2520800 [Sesamum angolense]
MSTSRGSGGGGVQPIPAGSRKVVQSLKEIVNCSEAEIYATLKECNMDPNEAVNRLLSQDSLSICTLSCALKFGKANDVKCGVMGKDNSDSRSRGANNSSNRGGKSGADRRPSRSTFSPYSSSESPLHGKLAYKKENGSTHASSVSSAPGMTGNNRSQGPPGLSDGASAESKVSLLEASDGMPSIVQPASGHQSAWAGLPGQVSMADIVRMGRPHNKASNSQNASRHNVQDPLKVHQTEMSSIQHVPANDDWPSIEKPPARNVMSVSEYTIDSETHPEASDVSFDSTNRHSEAEEVQEKEDDNIASSEGNDLGSLSISSRNIPEDDSRGASLFENDLYKDMGPYQSEAHDFERHEGGYPVSDVDIQGLLVIYVSVTPNSRIVTDNQKKNENVYEEVSAPVSSLTKNLQQLSVQEDLGGFPLEGNAPSVVIPDHLQVQTADCSHLSFGSFGSGMSAAYSSGTMTSVPLKPHLEDSHSNADISSVGHPDTSAGNYDASSATQPEELKPESAEMAHENQYPFPSSNPGYSFDDAQHLNAAFNQTSSQMQNLAPFSNAMALKTAGFSSTQPAPQTLSGSSVATGPPLPQHLAVHPYSQPTLPLGPFANMIGYPFLPQSYTYMPSAFQQSFAGSSTYHQSLAAVLPQYKSSVSVSSLPQSAAIASGYGAFGSTATIPGNYTMNPPAAPSGTTLSYDDVLSSQYKDSSQLLSIQQNENSAMWLHGPNSRTMPAVPASTYYNYQGQNQQPGGFRQGQQQSQSYGAPGYPNFYHSQTGILLDQQQNPRDGSIAGSQGQPKQSQIWPNSY